MKKLKLSGFSVIIAYVLTCVIVIATLFTKGLFTKGDKIVDNDKLKVAENLKASTYEFLDDKNGGATESEYVKFSAFFYRDLTNDGKADKVLGTCKRITETDVLYIDINVLSNGYLKDGATITVENGNFKYNTGISTDEILKSSIISENGTEFVFNKINAGTQKLITGEISAFINDNINNYNKVNKITLTGTHVADDGTTTEINKTIDLTIDWYGALDTSIYLYEENIYYNYDTNTSNNVIVNFAIDENKKELLLKDNCIEINIPSLNGYAPKTVTCVNTGVITSYDEINQILTINKSSEIDNNENITGKLDYSNTYSIVIEYSEEAIQSLIEETTIEATIKSYYTAYNNSAEEFENEIDKNIAKSNTAEKNVKIIFRETPSVNTGKFNFDIAILDKVYNSKLNAFILSKDVFNSWITNEDSNEKFEYIVQWTAIIPKESQINSIQMSEGIENNLQNSINYSSSSNESKEYGDQLNQKIISNCTYNSGIYFENADIVLGENGKITVVNNDTNEIINEFNKENWNNYNAENPYIYGEKIKHIRIETTSPLVSQNEEKSLKIYNIKEIDKESFISTYSKEDINGFELLYTYLEGKVAYTQVTKNESGEVENVEEVIGTAYEVDIANLKDSISYANITLENNEIVLSKALENEKIYITTKSDESELDSDWKNGIFVIEMPEEIKAVQINNVSVDNANVEIVSTEVLSKNSEKMLIKIITKNEIASKYTITVDCNLTPNFEIGSTNKNIILYAYNQLANRYYNVIEDINDINSNDITEENVGMSKAEMKFISSQELVTYEKVTNYTKLENSDEWSSEEIQAPNIAEVDNSKAQATINVMLKNNYKTSINNVKIMGRVPFINNEYILTGENLNSQFTAQMLENGIIIPAELKDKAVVYYSTNEKATNDLELNENDWKLLESVEDISKIKSYLIDLKGLEILSQDGYLFTYDVIIPTNVDNNLISYSTHTVYYDIETEEGILSTATEPSKVGIKIVRLYDLQINTYEKGTEKIIKTVKYELQDSNGNVLKTLEANSDGLVTFEKLLKGLQYKIVQIAVDENYEINEEIISFIVDKDGTVISNGKNNFDKNNNLLYIKVENELIKKYNLIINKVDEEGNELSGANFALASTEGLPFTISGNNEFKDLYQYVQDKNRNAQYILQETQAPTGYKLNYLPITFLAYLDENSNLTLDILTGEEFINKTIINGNTITLEVINEKGYPVTITKKDEDTEEPIAGVKFDVYKTNNNYETLDKVLSNVTTDSNGQVVFYLDEGLYKAIETEAPSNYHFSDSIDVRTTYFEVKAENYEQADFEVDSIEDLVELSNLVNNGENNFEGKVVRLIRDLDFNDVNSYESENPEEMLKTVTSGGYTPIGNVGSTSYDTESSLWVCTGNSFKGTFDGNGHMIKNSPDVIFGGISNAIVKNLSVDGVYNTHVSTMINNAVESKIYNCNAYGKYEGAPKNNSTGGIVFFSYGGVIDNCYNYVDIVNASGVVGGIVSYSYGTNIYNCGNYGNIGSRFIGGIVGQPNKMGDLDNSQIINCYNNGELYDESTSGAGMICGAAQLYYLDINNFVSVGKLSYYTGYAISSEHSTSKLKNGYYLKGIAKYGISSGDADGIIEAKTKEEMGTSQFINELNNNKNEINAEVKLENWYVGEEGTPVLTRIYDSKDITITNKQKQIEKFVVNKTDENGNPIQGAKFAAYKSKDYTYKNINTTPVETITTDENGQAIFYLEDGYYKIIETEAADGYIFEENIVDRTQYIKIEEKEDAIEIYYIEDLIEFANSVNSGNTYEGKTIRLMRTLDFNLDSSYRTTARDKFPMIGYLNTNSDKAAFKGIFDGNGNEIRNVDIDSDLTFVGFFGYILDAKILNFGITGEIQSSGQYVGGLVGHAETSPEYARNNYGWLGTSIINCYNKANVKNTNTAANSSAAGIVGYKNGSAGFKVFLINCYNTGCIESNGNTYGITYSYGAEIINSNYNVGLLYGEKVYGIGGTYATFQDSYYIKQNGVITSTINCYEKDKEEMLSPDFVDLLNVGVETDWVYVEGSYPQLIKYSNSISVSNRKMIDFTIIKEDAETGEKLVGAGFEIQELEEIDFINNMNLVDNGNSYIYNSNYHKPNKEIVIQIDLTEDSESSYIIECDALISSEKDVDIGYATITGYGYYYDDEKFMNISGEEQGTYYSNELKGGNYYNLHIGYNKESEDENDLFIIKKVTVNKIIKTHNDSYWTNSEGKVSVEIPSETKIKLTETTAPFLYKINEEDKYIIVTEKTNSIVIKNEKYPTNTFYKVDEDSNSQIYAYFDIYSVNAAQEVIGIAKTLTGEFLTNKYIYYGNELPLAEGYYKAVEVQAPNGYILEEDEELRTTYFEVKCDSATTNTSSEVYEISSIEDLVELSNQVNNGNTFEGITVKLMNNLDFTNLESYEDKNNATTLMTTLTNEQGSGFTPIGYNGQVFKGIFDGNNKVISNMYINSTGNYNGMFGLIEDSTIMNLTIDNPNWKFNGGNGGFIGYSINSDISNINITGEKNVTISLSSGGMLVGYADKSYIYNCNNEISFSSTSGGGNVGMIAGSTIDSFITKCSNTALIDCSSICSGIAGNINNTVIKDCYNTGNFTENVMFGAGITFTANGSIIQNCYNEGVIRAKTGPGIGGIVFQLSNSKMINSYNKGNIEASVSASGLVKTATSSQIINCYNEGNVNSSSSAGLVYDSSSSKIYNCYNKGAVACNSSPAVGLVFSMNASELNNCYNIGKTTSGISDNNGVKMEYGISYVCSNASTIQNCYYLDSTAVKEFYSANDSTVSYKVIDTEQTEEFANELNQNILSITSTIPLHKWQYNENSNPTLVEKEFTTGTSVTIKNKKIDYKVSITKKDIDTGEKLEGAVIKIERINENENGTTYTEIGKYTTSSNGTITVNLDPNYKYKITEVVSPDGYIKTEDSIIIEKKYEAIEVEIFNKKAGTYTIKKVDEDTGECIPGVKFAIYKLKDNEIEDFAKDSNGNYLGTKEGNLYVLTTDETGRIIVDLPDGSYKAVEVEPATDYILENKEVVFEVNQTSSTEQDNASLSNSVTITNKKVPKEYNITTTVEIPEGRVDKGGTISGEDEEIYEIVKTEENSTKNILIEPNSGYRVKEIRVVSTSVDGKTTEEIVYGDNAEATSEIKARVRKDGTVLLTQFININSNKEVIVVFEPNEGMLVVHHYIENSEEKIYSDEIIIGMVGEEVDTDSVEVDNYVLLEVVESEKATLTDKVQEIIYYYQEQYKITTEIVEYTEKYSDGTTKNTKGGKVEFKDGSEYEEVLKNRDNTIDIVITPDTGYEIDYININEKEFDFSVLIDENGVVTIPAGFFEKMQENKNIEVKFRKKSKVIVKYLEEGTQKVLLKTDDGNEEFIIDGYEGKTFETENKVIEFYENSSPEITIEDTDNFDKYDQVYVTTKTENGSKIAKGTMYADEITIIYWYKKIEADVVERHIEINEKGETFEIEHKTHTITLEEQVETNRKEYEGYISVDGPNNSNSLITVMKGNENSKILEPVEAEIVEVWYYYEKLFEISTEVKSHEQTVVDKETGETIIVQVDGGTISKEYKVDNNGEYVLDSDGNKIEEDVYEEVLSRGNATKSIVITPDDMYRIKSVTINNVEINLDQFEKDVKGAITIPNTYFADIQENKHIVVEFEKIPSKVIVKYIDIDTREEALPDKIIEGHIQDLYDEPRVKIDGYISAGEEPNNNKGEMTEETIIVIYYYQREFIITTEVREHEELKEKTIVDVVIETIEEIIDNSKKEKITVKGGSITGELTDENNAPIEIVKRGKENTKEIEIKPDAGYRIKYITIYEYGVNNKDDEDNEDSIKDIEDAESKYLKNYKNKYEIDTEELKQEDGSIVIKSAYFKNIQSNIHIIVEYEKIPAKVIVNYLVKNTEEIAADQEIGDGFVGDEYLTHEKNIPYYELLIKELPKNNSGILTEKDTIVTYWYRKLLFNMSIRKEFTSILVNNSEKLEEDKQIVKVDIASEELNTTNIIVKYKITVTNTEEIAGKAIVVEQIPVGFKMSEETLKLNTWKQTGKNTFELTTKELQPGESVEYEVIINWDTDMKCIGTIENIAKISNIENNANFDETTIEDNKDSRTLILAIRTGEDRTVKIIISCTCYVLATILSAYYVISEVRYRKEEK